MVDCPQMLAADDERWGGLEGGYRMPIDVRPLLRKLETGDEAAAWDGLWEELHHQGDVGPASYAAIPHIVRICRDRGLVDWNAFAMVGVIELARTEPGNPELPDWLRDGYFEAIQRLAEFGASHVLKASDSETLRSILAILAIAKGERVYGNFLLKYCADELSEMLRE